MIKEALLVVAVVLILIPFKLIDGDKVCHGVEICGVKYDCGFSDGICPEEYTFAKCYLKDPDCK
jgi:hypothetical protein